jgi:crotonobetainyl-CoA:carnitine CoA-transferase CaiB-like acyl-CoA transferase
MRPLEGIRVVEMGTHIVIPVAARVLGDWGAEVIKVEVPGGERWRLAGRLGGFPVETDGNPLYAVVNSGKEMISINLKSEEGMEVMLRLLADASPALRDNAAMLVGMVLFTALNYIGQRLLVFRKRGQ